MTIPTPAQPHKPSPPCLEAALRYKSLGLRVVLLYELDKKPIHKDWPKRDWSEQELRAQFSARPNMNIGINLGDGLVRIDIDNDAGAQYLQRLAGKPLPHTVEWKTPRGWGSLFRLPTASSLETTVIRDENRKDSLRFQSDGAQTVVPPSVASHGTYEWLPGCALGQIAIAELPQSIIDAIPKNKAQSNGHTSEEMTRAAAPASMDNLARATAYLATCAHRTPAIAYQAGHDTLFRVCCHLRSNFSLNQKEIVDLVKRHYNSSCQPPWTDSEIAHKAEDAYKLVVPNSSFQPNNHRELSQQGQPLGSPLLGQLVKLKPASLLSAPYHVDDWLIDGILGPGRITLFSGRGKDTGKTTFFAHAMRLMESGGSFCSLKVQPTRLAWFSEESEALWEWRRDLLAIGDWVHFQCVPFPKGKPTHETWKRFIEEIAATVASQSFDAVAIDTIAGLGPIKDENSNAEAAMAIAPFRQLTADGRAVLLVHHTGWGEERSRGAKALEDAVDAVIDYQMADKQFPNRRIITAKGRGERFPFKLTVELSHDRKIIQHVEGGPRPPPWHAVESILPSTEPGLSADEIHVKLPDGTLSLKSLKNHIPHEAEQRKWIRTGEGKPHHPYRYYRRPPDD